MRVEDVMTAPAITTTSSATFGDVLNLLVNADVHAVPVVDARGKLVGIVSEADVVRRSGHAKALGLLADELLGHRAAWVKKASTTTVRALMTRNPLTVEPADDLAVAAAAMLKRDHHLLPVVDERRTVLGVITRRDVMRRFEADDAYVATEIAEVLNNLRRAPEGLDLNVSVLGGIVSVRGTTAMPEDIERVKHVIARVPGVVAIRSELSARHEDVKRSESLAWRWRRAGAGTR